MQMDLRTVSITPLRQTFGHLERRMGADKPASRYMEATMDLQPVENFHYRPTWEPQYEIFDKTRTQVQMKDWDALKDPRQYYYGSWTLARGRMQETSEGDFDLVETVGLARTFPEAGANLALKVFLPLRHLAWGENLNNAYISAYSYGIAVSQATCYASMDQLGIAQYVSRLGMAFDDLDALAQAKDDWLNAPEWQGLRHYIEDLMVENDWFEILVAQNFVLDGLLFPLMYERFNDVLNLKYGPVFSMLTRFQREWYTENVKWIDAVLKVAANEGAENKAVIKQWLDRWQERALSAILPVAQLALADDAQVSIEELKQNLDARAKKIGLLG